MGYVIALADISFTSRLGGDRTVKQRVNLVSHWRRQPDGSWKAEVDTWAPQPL